ncbi:MAG: hypothetical protein Q7T16_00960 [Candidatus Burarchaeum sp.]|nr:hypothetical protein [Candidatus Burarchaeum sp.]MDO8339206.1 hypothetical protein [Candidatus Burarchaeum sp.]
MRTFAFVCMIFAMLLLAGCAQPAQTPPGETPPTTTPPATTPPSTTPPVNPPPSTQPPEVTPPAEQPPGEEGVFVYTDKEEYTAGESVKITVSNNLDETIYYAKGCTELYQVYTVRDGELQLAYLGRVYCTGPSRFVKINPGESMDLDEWDQKIAEGGGYARVLGDYKMRFRYFVGDEWEGKSDIVGYGMEGEAFAYSDEFELK